MNDGAFPDLLDDVMMMMMMTTRRNGGDVARDRV